MIYQKELYGIYKLSIFEISNLSKKKKVWSVHIKYNVNISSNEGINGSRESLVNITLSYMMLLLYIILYNEIKIEKIRIVHSADLLELFYYLVNLLKSFYFYYFHLKLIYYLYSFLYYSCNIIFFLLNILL